jgi:hypothetical protein
VLGVKCVSEIRAISILFSFSIIKSSFIWFVRPLAFQSRMVSDWEVKVLFCILNKKTVEGCGEER